jgi:hypothetical protein
VARVVEVLPDDAVLREVVWIEAPYKCFGEHTPIGAFGETQQSLSVVPTGLDGRVDGR